MSNTKTASYEQKLVAVETIVAIFHTCNYVDAEAAARVRLAHYPSEAESWNLLAASVAAQGRQEEAFALKQEIAERFPGDAAALNNYGNALLQAGKYGEAETVLRRALTQAPTVEAAWSNLSQVLLVQGRIIEAEAACREALRLNPGFANADFQLGLVLQTQGKWLEAWRHWIAAYTHHPGNPKYLQAAAGCLLHLPAELEAGLSWLEAQLDEALLERATDLRQHLGALQMRAHRPAVAERQFRAIVATAPENVLAWVSLGNSRKEQGDVAAAWQAYEKALTLNPWHLDAASQACMVAQLADGPASLRRDAAERFGRIVAKDKVPSSDWDCDPEPQRLVVGMVSGDWYRHPVAYFLSGCLKALNRSRIEIVGYRTRPFEDEWTKRLEKLCDRWVPLWQLTDKAAAERIREDRVHVLIDLSGHTAYNRLPVFAYRPAPVQVSWLGYFASTGVPCMDYLLADPVSAPPAYGDECTERLWHLPDTRLCYTPPLVAPNVARRSADRPPVFASFAQLTKITDRVLALWARVLAACPEARLRLQSRPIKDEAIRNDLIERAIGAGMEPARLELAGASSYKDYLHAYDEVDIVLDTFPYPGGTTTCEGLWMGVPTLTLAGETLLARQGASLLTAAGLDEWVARTEDEYIDKARAYASDLSALAALRFRLREQVRQSPLCDAPRFARNLEVALWEMWSARQAGA